ncbi:MAG: hypothetical protein Q9211_005849 [Gyalolechia sp. 1 TL-2023]
MSSINTTLDLNWRNGPKSTDIITDIRRFFTDIDSRPTVNLRLGYSTKADAVQLQENNGVLMLTRQNNTSPRSTKNAQYWARFVKTATLLNNMVVDKQALKTRFIQYRETRRHEKLDIVKRLMYDIAMTLQIHPTTFGIQQQESGMLKTPQGISLENEVVSDIFAYNDRQRTVLKKKQKIPGTRSIRLRGEKSIPCLVLDVNVKMAGGKVDAVVVVEHKNLSSILDIKNVLLVMTAGYPSSATKEYLHLLSQNPKLQAVPFLYFGDHDMGGFTIFQTLKYGSKNSAWASKMMVCPQLEYCGPLKQDLMESARLYRPQWEAQYLADHPGVTKLVADRDADYWQRKMDRKIKCKFMHHTKKDSEIKRSFDKLGWLDHEPLIKHEIDLIIGSIHPAKFRMADMTQVNILHLQRFIESKLLKRCANRAPVEIPPPVARGIRPQNTPSQPLAGMTQEGDELVLDTVETGDIHQTPDERSLSPEGELRALAAIHIP